MEKFSSCKICAGEVRLVNDKYNLAECLRCKFIFCLKNYSQDELIKTYDLLYNQSNSHYQKHSKDEFSMLTNSTKIKVGLYRARLLKKQVFQKNYNSVLEIGSGIGLVGAYIRQEKNTISYTGIELDKEAFEKSQLLRLNTVNGDFREMKNLTGQFDVIMMWEVLEHLQDLGSFLDLAYQKLTPNGKILLSTPNYNKILNYPARSKDQIFQDAPPIHLNFFTPESIKNIFEFHKFSNCKIMVKKFPYINIGNPRFYVQFIKALFHNYNGATIYFEATKD